MLAARDIIYIHMCKTERGKERERERGRERERERERERWCHASYLKYYMHTHM